MVFRRTYLLEITILICTTLINSQALDQNLSFQKNDKVQFKKSYPSPVGYRVGNVTSYNVIRKSGKSTLYQVVAPQLDDKRPMKLIDLHGNHYQVGYDYGFLLSQQIQFTYKTLFVNQFNNNQTLQLIFEEFFDWQYHSYVKGNIPLQYLDQIKGVVDGAKKKNKTIQYKIRKIIQRTLVISSIPSTVMDDVPVVLWDQFFRSVLRIRNQKIENYLQSNLFYIITKFKQIFNKLSIKCSFFGVWGSRTLNNDLYTMRNLDWTSDSGINANKLITIFNIAGYIPHATLGFPGLLGAITGISAKGITTHEAGQASDLQTLYGFQWTLRMRHILKKANNLNQAITLWNSTKNTLGMNFMIGSSSDKKAVVFEQMRGYSAMFFDNDPRENRTIFIDEKGAMYVAGFSMPQAVFRTNHAYDQVIRKHSHTKLRNKDSGTIQRYFVQRDMLNNYSSSNAKIGFAQAINMTAIMGAKQHRNYYSCLNNQKGGNVISVTYHPSQLKMWAAFQYGSKETRRSACCGVYIQFDLKQWFGIKQN